MTNASILIVGAGPSGLAMASALGRAGIVCRIIDAAKGPAKESRALAIQARTLEMFDLWGVAEEFVKRGLPVYGLQVHGEQKQVLFKLDIGGLPSRFPYVLMLPQSETEEILAAHVQNLGFNIERDTRLTSMHFDADGCEAILEKPSGENEVAKFDWIIGCDGAHSAVRDLSHATFTGKDYPLEFLLADVRMDWPAAPNEVQLYASRDGILGCFPMPGGYYRVVADRPVASGSPVPDLEEVGKIVAARGPSEAVLHDLKWSANFFIHARMVDSLQTGRTLLIGDAAHIHSPALAQGMNTGIQDAANLGWKLALVVKGYASESLLQTYHTERWPVEKGVLSQTDFVTKVMTGRNRVMSWLRDHIGPVFLSNERINHSIRQLVSELAVDYSNSDIVAQDGGDGKIKPGERAPDATLGRDFKEIRLYELMRGAMSADEAEPKAVHHLFILTNDALDLSGAHHEHGEISVHVVRQKGHETPDGYVDHLGEMEAAYGWNCAYLIRPDGYIGASSDLVNMNSVLLDYSSRIHVVPQVATATDNRISVL